MTVRAFLTTVYFPFWRFRTKRAVFFLAKVAAFLWALLSCDLPRLASSAFVSPCRWGSLLRTPDFWLFLCLVFAGCSCSFPLVARTSPLCGLLYPYIFLLSAVFSTTSRILIFVAVLQPPAAYTYPYFSFSPPALFYDYPNSISYANAASALFVLPYPFDEPFLVFYFQFRFG